MTTVKLTHPDSKQSIEVEAEHVGPYLTGGWAEPKAAPKPKDDDKS